MRDVTLVFDLDGTLIDTAPDLAAATNHVMARLGLAAVDEHDIRPWVGHGALKMIEQAARAHGRTLSEPELYDLFEIFILYYSDNIAVASRPYDGVVAALTTFKERGASLAVCTNKLERHARQVISELGLAKFFSALTGRDSLGVYKPDPGHLTGTIALAGGTPERAIMIGDSETDIKTAKAAGIPVVAVTFGYSVEPVASFAPDITIDHFSQLGASVERLLRPAA